MVFRSHIAVSAPDGEVDPKYWTGRAACICYGPPPLSLAERNKFATKAVGIRERSRPTLRHASPTRTSDPKQAMKDSVPPRDLPPGGVQQGCDGLGVGGVGEGGQVGLEGVDGLAGMVKLEADHAQVALFLGFVGGCRGKPALHAQGGREIVRSQIDRLQIAQHAGYDDSRRTGGDLVVRERDRVVGQVREPPLAAPSIEKFAGVEWVDEQRLAGVIEPEHEVRGKVYPFEHDAKPLGQASVQNGQADRNPCLAVDHLVQVAVPRIEVILTIPLVALFDEQRPVDLAQDLARFGPLFATRADPLGKLVRLAQVELDIQVGIRVGGDLKRNANQARAAGAGEQLLKLRTVAKLSGHAAGSSLPRRRPG